MKKLLKIAVFGSPGSGKGTQAEMLGKKYNLPVLAVGDIFRREIKTKTNLGKLIAALINQGELVPNEITNKIIMSELEQKKYRKGFILDGYPRNKEQLKIIEQLNTLTHAIELKVSDDEVIKRLSGRRICPKCGAIYHIKNKPPKKEGVCDACGSQLVVRDDDQPEAIKKRLETYHQETEPVLDYFFEKKKLIRVNGEQSIEKVFEEIVKKLKSRNI